MISFSGNQITVDGSVYTLSYKIKQAYELSGGIVVLFAPSESKDRHKSFRNLWCYSRSGKVLWVAELPTDEAMDRYYKIVSTDPLIAYSVCSYSCHIDTSTGAITKADFYK